MKSLFATRSFWYNALSALSLILVLPELQSMVGTTGLRYIVLVNAIINIVLRYVTTTPVKSLKMTGPRMIVLPLLMGLALTLSGCASLPAKEKAVESLQATEVALGAAQDAERALCNPTAAASAPTAPIVDCTGGASTAIGLTNARHQQIATALVKAFDAQAKAAVALRAWKAGDPVPTTVTDISTDAAAALAVVRQLLTTNPQVTDIIAKLQAVMNAVALISGQLGGAK